MKGIEIRHNYVYYYGNPAGYINDMGGAVVDNIFRAAELEGWLAKHRLEPRWMDGVYDRLSNGGSVQTGEPPIPLKSCRIWQLKPDVDVMMKFIGYEEMTKRFGELNPENYDPVYDGQIETNNLEEIWTKFNNQHPHGYTGYSLSMSDIIELYDHNGSEFHYVDRFGFRQVNFSGQDSGQTLGMAICM